MENRQKFRLPSLLRSSFISCRPRNLSDVVENSTLTSQTTSFRRIDRSLSSKTRHFPSIMKSETTRRPRVSEKHSRSFYASTSRQTLCPPASPVFPVNHFYEKSRSLRNNDKNWKKTNKKRYRRRSKCSDRLFSSSSFDGSSRFKSNGSWCWSSSDNDEAKHDEDDETDTLLFSSRSFSSESSVLPQKNPSRGRKKPICHRSKAETSEAEGILAVKEGFAAVVKKSSDPYEDFRVSMVEMIVERQIFGVTDLEQLLQCFLLLNSRHHHSVIVEVFLDICQTLFSN